MEHGFLFSLDTIPSYLCPSCAQGCMEGDVGSCLSRQTGESVALSKADYWEESFHKELLRVDLSCSNQDCKEVGVLVMTGQLYAPDENQPEAEILYKPTYIKPAPLLFKLESEYPEEINQIMREAFELFWSDPASCGNKVRVGVEVLLDKQGIEKERKNKSGVTILSKKGRPKPVMLHERLGVFKESGGVKRSCASALESIKWLGNESSHYGMPIHRDIVYKAVMIFGNVLACLYRNEKLRKDTDHDIKLINFWYHPDEQSTWPQKT